MMNHMCSWAEYTLLPMMDVVWEIDFERRCRLNKEAKNKREQYLKDNGWSFNRQKGSWEKINDPTRVYSFDFYCYAYDRLRDPA